MHRHISAVEKWCTFEQTWAPSIIQSHWTCAYALTQSQQTHRRTQTHTCLSPLRNFRQKENSMWIRP